MITIVIPAFNVGQYLESILNQTYQNFEIILIDDGSTDNTSRICDTYSQRDTRNKSHSSVETSVNRLQFTLRPIDLHLLFKSLVLKKVICRTLAEGNFNKAEYLYHYYSFEQRVMKCLNKIPLLGKFVNTILNIIAGVN